MVFGAHGVQFMSESVCKTKRKEAQKRLNALLMLIELTENYGIGKRKACQMVSKKCGFSASRLSSYQKLVEGLDKEDWFFALFPAWSSLGFKRAEIPKAAWDIFKADFLSAEKPCVSKCYDRLTRIAEKRAWRLPHKRTFFRRIRQELALNSKSRKQRP
jgi:hypothetical protein